ncbi:hypothetical protein TNIN_383151 [Trichonephila inaurata madagascariensis]|uniref:Uncharacterized protein n=1 Tax=Trichonephila inaurata madagascariensis TaxID=2747483 RepID=A0A8X6KPX9_9ARAC|nr:hypothetical protein TNIN_383151 [Trichonephila inaurata madagascariensis]
MVNKLSAKIGVINKTALTGNNDSCYEIFHKSTIVSHTKDSMCPKKKKSRGRRSSEGGGPRPVHLWGYLAFNICQNEPEKFDRNLSCINHTSFCMVRETDTHMLQQDTICFTGQTVWQDFKANQVITRDSCPDCHKNSMLVPRGAVKCGLLSELPSMLKMPSLLNDASSINNINAENHGSLFLIPCIHLPTGVIICM